MTKSTKEQCEELRRAVRAFRDTFVRELARACVAACRALRALGKAVFDDDPSQKDREF